MIDLLLIGVFSWLVLLGQAHGGIKMLVYTCALVGCFYLVEQSSPWLNLLGNDANAYKSFSNWIAHIMMAVIPAITGGHDALSTRAVVSPISHQQATIRSLYDHTMMIAYGLCVCLGIVMSARTLITLWPVGVRRRYSTWQGGSVGVLLGFLSVAAILKTFAVLSWLLRVSSLQGWLYQSVIVHAWTQIITHGIFN